MGIERLILVLENAGKMPEKCDNVTAFIGYVGDELKFDALKIVNKLRNAGISADTEFTGRSVKAQMKYAGKIGAKFTAILGTDELEKGVVNVKIWNRAKARPSISTKLRNFYRGINYGRIT